MGSEITRHVQAGMFAEVCPSAGITRIRSKGMISAAHTGNTGSTQHP